MPKKLTKTQVNKKLKLIHRNIGQLAVDKVLYGTESFVPLSKAKAINASTPFNRKV